MSSKQQSDVSRPNMATFSKNIWRDQFPPIHDSVFDSLTKEIQQLKQQVKDMLMASTADAIGNVLFIDALLRLGVSYHFKDDIENQLGTIFDSQPNLVMGNDLNLNTTSIVFRVFRQHGFKMSCGVFEKFKDKDGKFKKTVMGDAKGMLSLYEAAHLRVKGENILEEALALTKSNLKSLALKSSPHLAKQIMDALDLPINKSPPRFVARNYISFYEEDEESKNETLLKFAKLDFNRVQVLHKQEISILERYWKDNFPSMLSFARERYVEVYTWMNTLYFEPQYKIWRILLTKVLILISFIDDTFDAYGTPQELQCFIEALRRWEILDELQDYTKVICKAVLNFFDELEEVARKEGKSFGVPYAKADFIGLANNYEAEVKWKNNDHVPTYEEYISVAMKTSTFDPLITISFLGLGPIAGINVFEWLKSEPRIMKAANIIGRVFNDIVTHEFERSREHCPSSVECYMNENKVTEKEAVEELHNKLEDAWKDINEECMRPTAVARDLLLTPLNIARVTCLCYRHGDGYTHPDPYMKNDIRALFVDPIPI